MSTTITNNSVALNLCTDTFNIKLVPPAGTARFVNKSAIDLDRVNPSTPVNKHIHYISGLQRRHHYWSGYCIHALNATPDVGYAHVIKLQAQLLVFFLV